MATPKIQKNGPFVTPAGKGEFNRILNITTDDKKGEGDTLGKAKDSLKLEAKTEGKNDFGIFENDNFKGPSDETSVVKGQESYGSLAYWISYALQLIDQNTNKALIQQLGLSKQMLLNKLDSFQKEADAAMAIEKANAWANVMGAVGNGVGAITSMVSVYKSASNLKSTNSKLNQKGVKNPDGTWKKEQGLNIQKRLAETKSGKDLTNITGGGTKDGKLTVEPAKKAPSGKLTNNNKETLTDKTGPRKLYKTQEEAKRAFAKDKIGLDEYKVHQSDFKEIQRAQDRKVDSIQKKIDQVNNKSQAAGQKWYAVSGMGQSISQAGRGAGDALAATKNADQKAFQLLAQKLRAAATAVDDSVKGSSRAIADNFTNESNNLINALGQFNSQMRAA